MGHSAGTAIRLRQPRNHASKAYFRYKTITILIHKEALSPEMKKKLNIK